MICDNCGLPVATVNGLCSSCREVHNDIRNQALDEAARRPPTLRDRFAMASLTGLMGSGLYSQMTEYAYTNFSIHAYKIADAMLEARDKKGEQK